MKKLIIFSLLVVFMSSCGLFGHRYDKGKKFDCIDKNKDGKISKGEWRKKYLKKFKHKDTNKDGFLSKEEYTAKRKHCKKECPMKKK